MEIVPKLMRTCLAWLAVILVGACSGSGIHIPEAPPTGLHYSDPSVVYVRGTEIIPNRPSSSGGAIVQYSVSPALPAGLALNPQTGVITGAPSTVTPASLYTVTGSNSVGSATARLQIEVKDSAIAPDTLSYPDNPVVYTTSVAIIPNAPLTSGGEITQFGVTPALPAGLALNPQTGVVTGTPSAVSAATDYTVTGSNSAGSISTVLNIAVQARVVPPASLTYSDPAPVYTVGRAIVDNVPLATGGEITRYTVSPALPADLSMDAQTGVISGTPANVQASAVYTVTGSNSAGSVTASVSITVQPDLSGTWLPADSMSGARHAHTATVLTVGPNAGKVLVAGGTGASGSAVNSAEMYDPVTGAWSATGSMNQARERHTAILLTVGPNAGKVLVAGGGGSSGFVLNSAELYDPVTGTWSTTGSMSVARYFHTATLLTTGPDAGKVLVAGGSPGGTVVENSAELYDPTTGTWTAAGSLSQSRQQAAAVELTSGPNAGNVLVMGGYSSGSGYLNTAELYNPVTGTWSATGSMSEARGGFTANILTTGPNMGKVLVAGGGNFTSTELYDPVAGTWSTTGNLIQPLSGVVAIVLATGTNAGGVLVTGGNSYASSSVVANSELYDPLTGAWSASGSMSDPRFLHTATVLITGLNAGRVLVVGGFNNYDYLSSAELYVP